MNKRITVIIGGATGMGLAVAREVGKDSPIIIIGGRRLEKLEEAAEELKSQWHEVYYHTVDISDIDSVREFAEYANSIYPIGDVITVAGIFVGQADNAGLVRVNALGTVNVDNVFLPYMQEGSVLINFASNSGYLTQPTPEMKALWKDPEAPDFVERFVELAPEDQFEVYKLTKNFVINYTQANAMRFGKQGVRLFSISPGAFETQMMAGQDHETISGLAAVGRIGDPDEMGEAVRILLNPKLTYLTGCDILIDGGVNATVLSMM